VITVSKPAVASMTLLVAAVIVHDRDNRRVALLRRGPKAKFGQGLWDLPAGKNDPGEPITRTAVRELREETGLVVAPEDLRLVHVVHGARGVEAPNGFLTVVFAAHVWSGTLANQEPEKHSDVAWASTDALPQEFLSTAKAALLSYLDNGPEISLDLWPS
jgi:8-oxo-dGTP pyrophosphatase MutT (NUDIX family)